MKLANDIRVQNMIDLIQKNDDFMQAFKMMVTDVAIAGDPSFARFSQALIEVSRQDAKPLFGEVKAASRPNKDKSPRKDKAPVDNTWREEQKAIFSGRGMQWIFMPLLEVRELLKESDPVDKFMADAGKAWVRYAGPRIVGGIQVAAFELRNEGSKVPAPKNLVYMLHSKVMEGEFERLPDGKTPFALGLESDAPRDEESVDQGVEISLQEDEAEDEVMEMHPEETEDEVDLDIF